MIAVGWYTNKRMIKNSTDYLLAGRALPAILVAASLSANNVGGGSSVGVASRAFGPWGLSAGWYVLAAAIGIVPVAFFAPYLRRSLAYTIPEVVGKRFGAPSHLITAVVNVVALFCLTASQMLASGTIISVLTGMSLNPAILIAGMVCIVYTVMGGLWADAFTDLFQWVVIFFGLLIALPFIIQGAGGWSTVVSKVSPARMSFTACGWATIISLVFQYFITFISGPEMVSRIYAAKDERSGVQATLLSALTMGLYAFIPAIIGLVALAAFPDINPNQALAVATFRLAPGVIAGLICSAIIAATMSSADSDMLCASTIIVKDIYQRYINPEPSDRTLVLLTRTMNVVIGMLAIWIALFKINIITLNTFAFMLRSAGPFAAFALGLVWKNATRNAGLVSILVGSTAGIYWQVIGQPYGVLAIVAGSVASVIAFAITSFVEKAMGGEIAPALDGYGRESQ
ncbi:MAG: sodium:solute symporter family protein [Firmicutes bacterium]|nr:sodium:solute symporter family protein [Bacillota bacterium]